MSAQRILLVYLEPTSYLLGLIDALRPRWPQGIDVVFAGTDLSQRWDLALGDKVQVLPAGRREQWRFLRDLMTRERHAVVHLAGWGGHPVLPMALLLARWRGIPVTVESDTPLPHAQTAWKRLLKRLTYPVLFRLPSLFMPGGKRQAALLRHYGVGDDRIVIAGMTVDVGAIMQHMQTVDRQAVRQGLGIAADATVFLFVGRLEPHKGIAELLAAFAALQTSAAGACLLVVGEGSLTPVLQQAAGSDSRVKATGRLAGPALWNAFAAGDVFVLPSQFEPWGLVVNEAMAAGLPVIASERVGCIDDLVQHDDNGLVVPAGSAAALAAAMQRLLDAPALVAAMGKKSRLLISDWTLANEADNMVGGWKRLVAGQ